MIAPVIRQRDDTTFVGLREEPEGGVSASHGRGRELEPLKEPMVLEEKLQQWREELKARATAVENLTELLQTKERRERDLINQLKAKEEREGRLVKQLKAKEQELAKQFKAKVEREEGLIKQLNANEEREGKLAKQLKANEEREWELAKQLKTKVEREGELAKQLKVKEDQLLAMGEELVLLQALHHDDAALVQTRSDADLWRLAEQVAQEQARRKRVEEVARRRMEEELRRVAAQMEAQQRQIADQVRVCVHIHTRHAKQPHQAKQTHNEIRIKQTLK